MKNVNGSPAKTKRRYHRRRGLTIGISYKSVVLNAALVNAACDRFLASRGLAYRRSPAANARTK